MLVIFLLAIDTITIYKYCNILSPVSARTQVCRDRLLLAGRTDETLNSTPLTVACMAVTAAGESDMLGCAALRASFSTADSSECLHRPGRAALILPKLVRGENTVRLASVKPTLRGKLLLRRGLECYFG